MDINETTPVNAPQNEGAQATDEALTTQAQAWGERIKLAKTDKRIKEGLDRMRKDMNFAIGLQWKGQKSLDTDKENRYIANITLRHLIQRRAALYARNPTAVAHRRKTLDFEIWDGSPESLMMAQQTLMMAQQLSPAQMMDPLFQNTPMGQQVAQAQALLQDYQAGKQRRQMIDRVAESLEILWEHQIGEQQPPFKTSMKALVLRVLICSVGYLKIGFHRHHDYKPEDVARITDVSEQIAALEARLEQAERGDIEESSEKLAEMRQLLQNLTQEAEVFVREGLDIDFPRADSIIVDPACRQLKGFVGCRWIAQEFLLTADEIQEVYEFDISASRTAVKYGSDGNDMPNVQEDGTQGECKYKVYEVQDKHTRQVFTVCEGVQDYLVEPKTPDVQLERFWNIFALTFNDFESDEVLYPPSDVQLIRPMQSEINISKQRLREHRDAGRPGHVVSKGKLDQQDKTKLESRAAHDVVELNSLSEQDDIRRVLQPIPTNPIDPNLYETGSIMQDIYQAVGTQEAVMGGASGATATETSIAESSRLSSIGEAVDELDDFLTEVTRAGSQLLLAEFNDQFVKEVAGPGAVWPDVTAPEIAKDLWLEVRAGSSGRPNKAVELQNVERVMPFLLQIPGVKPKRLLQEILDRLDDRLPIDEFYQEGAPSMVAANAATQPSTGDAGSDPNQQGGQGADKNAVEQGDSNLGPRPPAEERNMDPNRA